MFSNVNESGTDMIGSTNGALSSPEILKIQRDIIGETQQCESGPEILKIQEYQTHSRQLFIPFLYTLFPLHVHSHHGLSKIIHTPKVYTYPRYPLLSYVLAQARPTMFCIH